MFTEFDVRSVTAVSRCISTLWWPRGFCMQVLGWGLVSPSIGWALRGVSLVLILWYGMVRSG